MSLYTPNVFKQHQCRQSWHHGSSRFSALKGLSGVLTFPRHWLQRKPLVSDLGMHHATCVTHVPWCMSVSLACDGGETFPAFAAHAQPAILRIWQEDHGHRIPSIKLMYWTLLTCNVYVSYVTAGINVNHFNQNLDCSCNFDNGIESG